MREIAKIIGGDKVKFDTSKDLTHLTGKEFKEYLESYMDLMSYKHKSSFFSFVEGLPQIDPNLRADIFINLIDIDRLDAEYKDSFEVDTYNEARINLLDNLLSISSYANKREYIKFVFSGKFYLGDLYNDVGYSDKDMVDALMGGDSLEVVSDIEEKMRGSVHNVKRRNLLGLILGRVSFIVLYLTYVMLIFRFILENIYIV